ncbi:MULTISPECIES: acyltransferase [unclassified Minwuia]|jgi:peptidoglycan/LPS O-acetylase OafA/YrhL|uniref:acyltransferase family protein n=1 Tax=unclassified Minwuia TaxID=2618799 RepID=UPI002479444E|nr:MULTISPECIES: acyltransferase [unclassified Minwuia]
MARATERIEIIELVRGLAALAVALFHFANQLTSGVSVFLTSWGWLGVDAFFIISGVVIPYSLYGMNYRFGMFPRFMAKRIVRLEPPYVISILLTIVLWHVSTMMPGFQGSDPDYTLGQILSHLFYLTPLLGYEWLGPVYWTLAYEFVFYITMGLTFSWLIGRSVLYTMAAGGLALLAVFLIWGKVDYRLFEFLVGFLIMRWYVLERERTLTAVLILATLFAIYWFGGQKTIIVAVLTVATIWLLRSVRVDRRLLWLGTVSYSLYLTHVLTGGRVVNLMKRFVQDPALDLVIIGAATAVALAFSWLFWRLIEVPALRQSRRIRIGD